MPNIKTPDFTFSKQTLLGTAGGGHLWGAHTGQGMTQSPGEGEAEQNKTEGQGPWSVSSTQQKGRAELGKTQMRGGDNKEGKRRAREGEKEKNETLQRTVIRVVTCE